MELRLRICLENIRVGLLLIKWDIYKKLLGKIRGKIRKITI